MNAMWGLGTLLFGAWVLPGVDFGTNQALFDQPSVVRTPYEQDPVIPREPPPAVPLDVLRTRPTLAPTNPGVLPNYYGTARTSNSAMLRESYVPTSPTDPALASPDSPWAPPTESMSPTIAPGFGTRGRAFANMASNMAYGAGGAYGAAGMGPPRQPTSRGGSSEGFVQQLQTSRLQATSRPNAVLRTPKPFYSYTPPPTTSPYMNLFRPTTNGVVDNYSNLVRPQLSQQEENQVFSGQIRGLRTASRLHSSILQQRSGNAGQSGATDYYMNYGGYYPLR
jgi:hypothetical protein